MSFIPPYLRPVKGNCLINGYYLHSFVLNLICRFASEEQIWPNCYVYLGIGGDSTGLHIDAPGTASVNFLLLGSKDWYFLPEENTKKFTDWLKNQYGIPIGTEENVPLQALRLFQGYLL
jgi:hypothetical protein